MAFFGKAREERRVPESLTSFTEEGHHTGPIHGWSVSAEQQVLDRETHRLIEAAIDRLPEMYRDVYVLADVEGLPNAETAEILGLSVSAVKSRLHRARLMMRDLLAHHFEEAPA
jgi:RNA polymerase sigma-70 factor (ECF subfamily)